MGNCRGKPATVEQAPPVAGPTEDEIKKEEQRKAKETRAQALNRIEETMKMDIEFVKNEANITAEGSKICTEIATILVEYPELVINIESHTSCSQSDKFNCNEKCRMLELSQGRVESIKQELVKAGCKNDLQTKGWGCKHPTIGSVRKVMIFPEDKEWD